MPNKQSFETRFTRLIHMLDLMSNSDGIEKGILSKALGVPERTLERDVNLLSKFFRIEKGFDSGKRIYYFDKHRFNFDDIRKPLTIDQIREVREG